MPAKPESRLSTPTEDALSAAQEETEKYRALYEELAGEENGTP